jgi:hypothetical protein
MIFDRAASLRASASSQPDTSSPFLNLYFTPTRTSFRAEREWRSADLGQPTVTHYQYVIAEMRFSTRKFRACDAEISTVFIYI